MINIQEKNNILRIFQETKKAIGVGNFSEISELSNQTIDTASRTQDPDNVAVAVIIYSIGKILSRQDYRKYPGWKKYYQILIDSLDEIISALQKNEDKRVSEELNEIRDSIEHLSGNLKIYIQDVFRKASINKASKIYEHGISMETTSKLLGITIWELASYSGSKSESPTPSQAEQVTIKKRIKFAMEMFE